MKISTLTIALVLFALTSLWIFYSFKGIYDAQNELCNAMEPKHDENDPEWQLELWKNCITYRRQLHSNYGIAMFTSIIFIFLIILSWKVDHIMKNKK